MTSSTSPPDAGASTPTDGGEGKRSWLVYLLRCADDTLYTGCTNDLDRRLAAHGRGRVKYTRGRLPVAVVHSEPAASRGEAQRREAAIKRLPRRGKLLLSAPTSLC